MTEVSSDPSGTPAGRALEKPVRPGITGAAPGEQFAHTVIQLVIIGDRPVINYVSQHTVGDGTNAAVAGGTAVAADGQALYANRHAVIAEQDAIAPGIGDQLVKEGWWARLRRRGAVVALAIIIGALASVASVVLATMIGAGWTP